MKFLEKFWVHCGIVLIFDGNIYPCVPILDPTSSLHSTLDQNKVILRAYCMRRKQTAEDCKCKQTAAD